MKYDAINYWSEVKLEIIKEYAGACAGFKYVPEPMPMRNSKGAIVYYLFFASHKPVAEGIVKDIFDKFRTRGIS